MDNFELDKSLICLAQWDKIFPDWSEVYTSLLDETKLSPTGRQFEVPYWVGISQTAQKKHELCGKLAILTKGLPNADLSEGFVLFPNRHSHQPRHQ